ncbi:CRISPR-associated helicase Cas3' [Halobacteroides halobius]|uniref:CRISPR-associated helicase Cas3' n=1 Tax=Halobacteroides halobius TaxID=42422 RepID=UPI002480A586|nr:CRISPR-associated helicase Cas3' [Halobacteroides halobius]
MKEGFEPFKYQREVAEAILNGENVILQAPTGAGKTLASTMPYIIANEEGMNFPKKLIYSTPRRTLVNSLYSDILDEIKKGDFTKEYDVTIQTGEKKEDRYFNGDIIFTTFDQSLSSALSMPISLSNRLGNINVGAFLSSYLIFDEFHLFDLSGSYTTTVLLLEKLKDKVPFCVMTATISEEKINALADKLDARVIRADSSEYLADIVTQQGKERRIFTKDNSLDAEEIVKLHNQIEGQSKKSIVMCNRVENAQQIYEDINKLVNKEDGIETLLIHSRFLDEDRKRKEKQIKKLFAKDNDDSNVILVSTQVIEVGIDITSDIMHTEISAIDSFLQRIGRCARYRNQTGKVYVYDVLNEGDNKYLPYDDEVTLKTFSALQEIDGEVLTSELSQQIIDRVYSEETDVDAVANEKVDCSSDEFIKESWKLPDKDRFNNLIRNVIACSIVISPWVYDNCSPYNYQSLSISPGTLRSKVAEIAKETDDWLVKKVIERDDDSDFKYTYGETTADEIYPNNLYILNPDYFGYNLETGLVFDGTGKKFDPLPISNQEPDYDNTYKEESYLQHIESMNKEVPELEREMSYAIELIKDEFDLSADDFRDIVEFTIWAHDLGKLQEEWQLAHKRDEYDFIAHAERKSKPPSHAAESFWIVLELLEDFIFDYLENEGKIVDIIGKAMISHHSLNLNRTDKYTISTTVKKHLLNINADFFTEKDLTQFINKRADRLLLSLSVGEDISDEIRVRSINQYLFYFVLVRILRLADQRATKKLNQDNI